MKKLAIIQRSRGTKIVAGKPGIQKSVKVEVPPPVTQLPAHERAARQRRLLAERPRATHKAVSRLESSAPSVGTTFVRHHLSF